MRKIHPDIEAAIKLSFEGCPAPNQVAQDNAERLIMNIANKGLFEWSVLHTTWAGGLSIYLKIKEWQFHMQSTNEGMIFYVLWKGREQFDCGCDLCDDYIPKLVYYLNAIKFRA